jgi:hypothetical protein
MAKDPFLGHKLTKPPILNISGKKPEQIVSV